MTPKRKSALQWFHDQGEIAVHDTVDKLSSIMIQRLLSENIINTYITRNVSVYSLTDKGRRMLNGDAS